MLALGPAPTHAPLEGERNPKRMGGGLCAGRVGQLTGSSWLGGLFQISTVGGRAASIQQASLKSN